MRKIISTVPVASLVLAAIFSSSAYSAPQSRPNGPWVNSQQNVSLAALRSYEQLWQTLRQIDRSAKGSFVLAPAPRQSQTGRDIPVVTIGEGSRNIMIIAQQHGNEYVVSEAMVELIRDLSDNSRESRDIRSAVTLTVVPRVNVDGFDAEVFDTFGNGTPWRQNYAPSFVASPLPPWSRV